MGKLKKNRSGLLIFAIFTIIGLFAFWQLAEFATAQVLGTDILYTTDSDFDQGTLLSVNHDAPNNDQLQLDQQTKPFPFINVAASGRGTVVRTDTETGEIVGEYRTAPEGRGLNPSRTTVDLFGNVWTANRDEADSIDGIAHGSAVKIGLIVGGSRVNENGESDPAGGYLAPPFGYNTCADRDGDGLIRTSNGLGDVLDWPDITDGMGGADGMVEDAVDECILIYQRLSDAENARHVSVDADNNVWVGGYPFQYRMFYKLDGSSGAILDSFDAREIGCGGYGGLIDGNGILWSVGGPLLRYDPTNRTGICIQQYGYGLGIDTNGYIWLSLWDGGIVKIAPDGTVMPGYPKPTYLPMAMPPAPEPGLIPAISAPALAPMVAAETQVWHEPTRMILAATQEGMEANEVTPSLRVSPVDDWVQSFGPPWTPGATISLTIEDGGAVVYSDSQTADGDGNFNFNLWGIFDVQRGQVVTVSDGITTKTHTVTNLYVDGIDVDGDDVFGRADPGTEVHVWVHGNGDVFTTTDGDGNWRADFSGQTDLTYLSDGGAQQIDSDSDSTTVWWASPQFWVAPVDEWVQSRRPWTPGATITLTIEDGGAVVYSDSQTADANGNFNFNLWDVFDLQRGQVVTVSDGTNTKTHTVANLYVDGVDIDGDDVYGRAEPEAAVHIWVHGNGDLFTTADSSGSWLADFSGQTDLTFLNDGGSEQIDNDGDSTGVWWASPRIQVAPVDDWVQSIRPWTPGATITLTIEEGGSVVYSDSQTADADGNFNFNLWDVFDLQRGQVVIVSDGTTTKTHTITNLYVDGIDIDGDDVFGRADPGTDVQVWVHGDGNVFTTADGSGSWRADFSGQTDLTYMNDGGSEQVDSDGDSTGVWWASPQFQVAPVDDWIGSKRAWTPDATITLTIEDGGNVVYSDSQTADPYGNFNFNLWDVFDVKRGQVVTVSDGMTTKTHTVANLYVDGVDVDGEVVYGRADPGTDVHVWVHGDGDVFTTADGDGNWLADFSGQTDLTFFNDGGSQQTDEDGDSTGVWWASPQFQVAPVDDWIGSKRSWMPDATITLTIEDGGVVVYSDSQTADPYGNFNFNLWDVFDVQRGQVVTVSDGMTTKTHTVMELYVDGVDLDNEIVFGRGEPGIELQVWVDWNGNVFTTPDGDGNWLADFSSQTDLNYLSQGGVEQYDDDGDSTGVWWTSPRFQVNPLNDVVQSRTAWAPLATILLTIEEGGFVVYSDWQTADGNGNFHFDLWGRLDLQPGQVVTVSDGTTTKSHIITNLYVSGVDVAGDDVFGTAEPGTQVDVHVGGDGMLTATADGDGNWLTDFTGMTDISYLSDGNAEQLDSDGDGTRIRWAGPRFQVAPDDEWVGSSDWWTPGATVSLTIEDGGVVVYSDSQTVDANGSFNFNLWDVFDLQRGQVVTVSDGTTTKTHTVWNLYVDGFDITSETVYGRAQAGTDVEVWVHGDGNLIVTADGSGNWVADFSGQTNLTYVSDGGSQQSDEDGDSTGVWWASPRFQAAPDENWVQSSTRWTPGALIMLTIEEGGVVVYSGSVTADSHGNFYTDIWGVDMAPGQVVTVSDGLTTKTHTITDLMVTSIDTVNEQILGTANAGAQVEVRVSLFDQGASRWVTTDAGGNWVADFSVPADGQPAYDISGLTQVFGYENDEDGDQTYRRFGPPQQRNRGVAVTPVDNHVWVASSGSGTVTRLDNDGNVLKVIETGTEPTGVAIDAAGKVWATNLGSDNAVRIDPSAGPDGLGAVDLTVDLGPGASPYNYSDMTGAVVVGSTSPQGFWAIIQDSLTAGFEWGRITWNSEPQGSVPPGTEIVVEARSAESESGLGGQTFQPVVNGELFSMFGRFIEVRVTLKTSVAGVSPVLSDIRIQPHVINVGIDIKPGSFPNTISCLNRKETITVAVLTTDSFNAMSVDHTTVTFEGAREMHVDRKTGLPLRHIEDVDLDGDLDLVFHFMRRDTALTCSSVAGTLTGMTYDGIPIEGTDSVRMVK